VFEVVEVETTLQVFA